MSRIYPDEPARTFDRPPISFADAAGEEITIEAYASDKAGSAGNGTNEAIVDEAALEAAFVMYVGFDPADRAQGIPPTREEQIDEWLTMILGEGYDVLAWDGEDCVGHATLVPDGDNAYELAIFVANERQGAGIGSMLMEGLLGYGQQSGVERVWLTVERWNDAAMALYRKFGFETSNAESFEQELAIRL